MTKSKFSSEVYRLTRKIPSGKVATYGQIAASLGNPKSARAVGQALHRNPYAPEVPCHRVVAANGYLCGFVTGLEVKKKLLKAEGVEIIRGQVDLKRHLCKL